MARSTYHDQFKILIDKGYLVQTGGNTYTFYETPRPRAEYHEQEMKCPATAGRDFENDTIDGQPIPSAVQNSPSNDTEININMPTNNLINSGEFPRENEVQEQESEAQGRIIRPPEVKVITIAEPQAKGRETVNPRPQIEHKFIFDF